MSCRGELLSSTIGCCCVEAEVGIRGAPESRGLREVYKRQQI
ncbi:hypothetical protein [Clostridioides difficile]|nr:hypothetical protein [Clostridioides difficile]